MTRLQPGTPVNLGDVSLMIIARLIIDADNAGTTCWLHAHKEPYAIVIRDASGLRALDMAGRRLPITELTDDVPGLESISQIDTQPM